MPRSKLKAQSSEIFETGWVKAGETWTYDSSDNPTYTFTISAFDATTKYSPGMRIKLTDSGTQYFLITKVVFDDPGSTITIYGGTDYDLSTGAITNPFYSSQKAPFGFPLEEEKWSEAEGDTVNRIQNSPTANVWYNLGAITLSIPIGNWRLNYKVTARGTRTQVNTGSSEVTLSTGSSSESDPNFSVQFAHTDVENATKSLSTPCFVEKSVTVATKTSYYLNMRTDSASQIDFRNALVPAIIRATSAYL